MRVLAYSVLLAALTVGCGSDPAVPAPIGYTPAPPAVVPDEPKLPDESGTWNWEPCGSTFSGVPIEAQFASAGTSVIAQYEEGRLVRHDVTGGTPKLIAMASTMPDSSVVSPDGQSIAEYASGRVTVWSVEDGTILEEFDVAKDECGTFLSFAADGSRFALNGAPALCVLDRAGNLESRIEGRSARLVSDELVTVEGKDVVRYSLDGQELTRTGLRFEDSGFSASASQWDRIVLSPDGGSVATIKANAAALFSTATGEALWVTSFEQTLHNGVQLPVFSADARYAVIARTLVEVDTAKTTALHASIPQDVRSVSSAGKEVVARRAGTRLGLAVLDVATGTSVRALGGHDRPVISLDVAEKSGRMLSTQTSEALGWELKEPFSDSTPLWIAETGMELRVSLSDDARLATVSGDGAGLFDAITGHRLDERRLSASIDLDCYLVSHALAPSGRWIASNWYDYVVEVVEPQVGGAVVELPSASCNTSATFNRTETFLATSVPELYRTSDWQLVWSAPAAQTETVYIGAEPNIRLESVQFSPDDAQLIISRCELGEELEFEYEYFDVATGEKATNVAPRMSTSPAWGTPDISPGGRWLLLGGALHDRRTGGVTRFSETAVSSVFLTNLDIIAGNVDGTLTRYCRVAR